MSPTRAGRTEYSVRPADRITPHSRIIKMLVALAQMSVDKAVETKTGEISMATVGGVRDSSNQNSLDLEQLARYAVDEENKKQNSLLEFSRLVSAKEQVVAGTMHILTIEVTEAGKKKLYEAKVWVKPWMDFKKLEEFKYTGDS
ncbi:Cysteine proteinase inhibitor 6 [Asimina triloba]